MHISLYESEQKAILNMSKNLRNRLSNGRPLLSNFS